MKINKTTLFGDIEPCTKFNSKIGVQYLKTQHIENSEGYPLNAVRLPDGELYCFEDSQEVVLEDVFLSTPLDEGYGLFLHKDRLRFNCNGFVYSLEGNSLPRYSKKTPVEYVTVTEVTLAHRKT